MKRIITLVAVAALTLATAVKANAQLGAVAGFTSSSTNIENMDTKSVALYHLGVAYKLELGMGLAIQPELIYQMKGAEFKYDGTGTIGSALSTLAGTFETKTGYLEVPVEVQWGIDLGIAKPYVFLAPFLGYAIVTKEINDGAVGLAHDILNNDENATEVKNWANSAKNRVEYGIGGGLGVELLGRIQVSAQYFKNLGNLYQDGNVQGADVISTSIQNAMKDKNYGGIKFSAVLFF